MIDLIHDLEGYQAEYQRSVQDPEGFWAGVAEGFHWHKLWDRVLDWNFEEPSVRWFEGGLTNLCFNAVDRHALLDGDRVALIWEPNSLNDAPRQWTYRELQEAVARTAGMLQTMGVQAGDRVCLYMPMIPELLWSVLACARLGAVHSVVFGGFSARSLADRVADAGAAVVVCSEKIRRGPRELPCRAVVEEALDFLEAEQDHPVRKVLVQGSLDPSKPLRSFPNIQSWDWDRLWDQTTTRPEPRWMDAEDPLFILYTSGSTGKPKGVLHSTGGYMVYTAYSFAQVFRTAPGDVFWCTADIGWITGHSYLAYGPLLQGATVVMFEGIPTYPDPSRFWKICERHRVSHFYTAPTAIRALMVHGDAPVQSADLSSLRVLGSVGEPINEEAWQWYHRVVGGERCPVTDTWWQTETGGILIGALAGLSPLKPTYAGRPLPGVQPVLLDPQGRELEPTDPPSEQEGLLAMRFPWPSILRSTWGDHERCRTTYFSPFPGYYFTGDGARRDVDGMFRIIGRVDDVINVSGHRLGTAEIENALNRHPRVVESAVVGYDHPIKGQGIYAYVILRSGLQDLDADSENQLIHELSETVVREIGAIARPDRIQLVEGLPKTRSGKIMRRFLRKIASGDTSQMGDTTTLLDPSILEAIWAGRKG